MSSATSRNTTPPQLIKPAPSTQGRPTQTQGEHAISTENEPSQDSNQGHFCCKVTVKTTNSGPWLVNRCISRKHQPNNTHYDTAVLDVLVTKQPHLYSHMNNNRLKAVFTMYHNPKIKDINSIPKIH